MKRLLELVGFTALFLAWDRAEAAAPPEIALVTDEEASCPSRAAVVEALGKLLPELHLVDPDVRASAPIVTLVDEGPGLLISGAVSRRIPDEERRCDERARSAALVIAMALETPAPAPDPGFVPPPRPRAIPRRFPLEPPIERRMSLGFGRFTLGYSAVFAFGNGPRAPTTADFVPLGGAAVESPTWGSASALDLDVGVGGGVQLGLTVAWPHRNADLQAGTAITRFQIALHRAVALRLEAGFDGLEYTDGDALYQRYAAYVSMSLPMRWRVHRMLAITALGGGTPRSVWPSYFGRYDYGSALVTSSQSLVAIRASDHGPVETGLFASVGLLFQPHPMIGVHAQVGGRLRLADTHPMEGYVPVSLDLVVSPTRFVDVGVSVEVPVNDRREVPYGHVAAFIIGRL